MPLASIRRSPPLGRKETTVAEYSAVGTQWSHGAEIPSLIRPSGPRASPFTSPLPAGIATTVLCDVKAVPSKPPYAVTPPEEAT